MKFTQGQYPEHPDQHWISYSLKLVLLGIEPVTSTSNAHSANRWAKKSSSMFIMPYCYVGSYVMGHRHLRCRTVRDSRLCSGRIRRRLCTTPRVSSSCKSSAGHVSLYFSRPKRCSYRWVLHVIVLVRKLINKISCLKISCDILSINCPFFYLQLSPCNIWKYTKLKLVLDTCW